MAGEREGTWLLLLVHLWLSLQIVCAVYKVVIERRKDRLLIAKGNNVQLKV